MKALAARLVAYVALGLLCAGLLFYSFGKLEALLGTSDAEITGASNAKIAQHRPFMLYRDSLRKAQRDSTRAVDRLVAWGNGLRRSLDSAAADTLADTAGGPPFDLRPVDWRKIALGWRSVADSDSAAVAKCTVVVLTCAQRAANAEAEADTLARQLKRQTAVRDHPCGVSAGVGVLAGQVVTFQGQAGFGVGAGVTLELGCHLFRLPWP